MAVNRDPVTVSAWRQLRAWRDEWSLLGTSAVLTLIADDGPPVTHVTALRYLEKEILCAGVISDPQLPDPARYPAPRVRPPKTWSSETGGHWAHTWHTGP